MAIQAMNDVNANAVSVNPLSSITSQQAPVNQEPTNKTDDSLSAKQQNQVQNEKVVASQKKEPVDEQKELEEAVEVIADFMNVPMKNVNFDRADGSDKTVIKVYDSESQELIKQFPSEEVLEIAQRIVELRQDVGKKTGILFDEKV